MDYTQPNFFSLFELIKLSNMDIFTISFCLRVPLSHDIENDWPASIKDKDLSPS